MRALWVVLLLALAGCSSPEAGSPDPTPSAPEPPDEIGTVDGFVRDAQGAVGGAQVTVAGTSTSTASATDGSFTLHEVPVGRQTVIASMQDRNGSTTLDVQADGLHTIFIDLGVDALAKPTDPLPTDPSLPTQFACPDGNVTEAHATFGQADGMVWAALKTGFRAVVAWDQGELEYHLGAAAQTATQSPLVLDGLSPGQVMCFRSGNTWHAMRMANAMNAYDGAYTANFLVLANEGTNMALLEKGVQRFAELSWDASDGHIRIGAVITVVGDVASQDEAIQPCWNANVGVHYEFFESVLCARLFDFIFSHNVNPAAAGATYKDGIQDPNTPVWMNAVHEAGLISGLFTEESQVQEVSSVLTHEVGHYMLGAQDLYPEANVVTTDCYQASTGISIMSSSREATEYDSKSTPCKDASSSYRPTWGLLMERFPMIPEREGAPLAGPEGDGGGLVYHVIDMGP